jgi:uncharacterized membrane protein
MVVTPGVLHGVLDAAEWIRLGLELLGAASIAVGAMRTIAEIGRAVLARQRVNLTAARFELSRCLALAVEFQLAADVLETAVAPDWTTIGHLAAIGAIRTALNYFLSGEIKQQWESLTPAPAPPSR